MAKTVDPSRFDAIFGEYKPQYAVDMINFFNIDPYIEESVMQPQKQSKGRRGKGESGDDQSETPLVLATVRRARHLPLLSRFAFSIGKTTAVLESWCDQHEEFAAAYMMAKDLQEYILVTNCLMGLYERSFGIFATKNLIGWRDKIDMAHSTTDSMKTLMNEISGINSGTDLITQRDHALRLVVPDGDDDVSEVV